MTTITRQVPRDYQQRHLNAIDVAIMGEDLSRVCIESATGTGKGSIIAWLVQWFSECGSEPVLVIAHTETIVRQLYERIRGVLGMDIFQVGIEQGELHARHSSTVIVASVQTLLSGKRLEGWKPKALIVDECHHYGGSAAEWVSVLRRFGAFSGDVMMVGLSATLQRGDKMVLFAYDVDGKPTLQGADSVGLANCVFQKCVSRYDIVEAINDSVLVPVIAYSTRSEVDMSGLKKTAGGDYSSRSLCKKVDAPGRTQAAFDKWEEHAKDRQTMGFCADVQHAYHCAQLWRERGYTAEAADGSLDKDETRAIWQRFKDGQTQVLFNYGLWIEGADCDAISCLLMLRPTALEGLYKQMAGRGLRPLAGIVDKYDDPVQRAEAIANSAKPNCLIIDVVDNNIKGILSAPALIGLPPDIDLQGHDLQETKRMLQQFEKQQKRIAEERPQTYEQLDLLLHRVDVLGKSGASTAGDWRATSNGYIYTHTPPGFNAYLDRSEDDRFTLRIVHSGETLYNKKNASKLTLPEVFDIAASVVGKYMPKAKPKPLEVPLYTKLKNAGRTDADKIVGALRARGHQWDEINKMTVGYAKKLSAQYRAEYRERMLQHDSLEKELDRALNMV